MKKFIGIDQSYTSTGIIVLNEDASICECKIVRAPQEVGDIFKRAHIIATAVCDTIKEVQPACLGIEGLAFSKFGDATRDLAGLQFVLLTYMRYSLAFDAIVIPTPNEVKKFATTKGSADKVAMYEALPQYAKDLFEEQKIKKTKGLYDVTDAFWIAKYALEIYNKKN